MTIPFDAFVHPEKHGYQECGHCNGYGSSLKDPEHQRYCSQCGGSGLVKVEKKD
jgi:DnaJ-class molecular chaperone